MGRKNVKAKSGRCTVKRYFLGMIIAFVFTDYSRWYYSPETGPVHISEELLVIDTS